MRVRRWWSVSEEGIMAEQRQANPFSLEGQLALVTGGGTGIGLAICKCLVASGARVVITGRREAELAKAVAELGKEHCAAIPHDITKLGTVPGLVKEIEEKHGELSILVNNAGINFKRPAVELSDEEFNGVLQTHLYGSFALSREAAKVMIPRKRGSMIMILSMASEFGIPLVAGYTAAKSGMKGLVRGLATEWSQHKVRINGIAPGWIDTDMSRKAFAGDPERKRKVLSRTPMDELGTPDDIGYAAVYLSSPAAKFITGTVLCVDGGVSIGF
jgi:gluconate 5-dehydrogenase